VLPGAAGAVRSRFAQQHDEYEVERYPVEGEDAPELAMSLKASVAAQWSAVRNGRESLAARVDLYQRHEAPRQEDLGLVRPVYPAPAPAYRGHRSLWLLVQTTRGGQPKGVSCPEFDHQAVGAHGGQEMPHVDVPDHQDDLGVRNHSQALYCHTPGSGHSLRGDPRPGDQVDELAVENQVELARRGQPCQPNWTEMCACSPGGEAHQEHLRSGLECLMKASESPGVSVPG
jgi:hypothetical protein